MVQGKEVRLQTKFVVAHVTLQGCYLFTILILVPEISFCMSGTKTPIKWLSGCVVQEEAEAGVGGEAAASPGDPGKRAGLQVAPWLRLGSLRDFSSKAAEHALMPALRQRWR